MPSSTIDIEIRARTEALTAELAKATNLSKKETAALAREIVKQGQVAEKAAATAAAKTEKHWTGALKKVSSVLGEGTIPKFEKLSGVAEAFGAMSGASAAQVAVLTGGISVLTAGALYLSNTVNDTVTNLDSEVDALNDVQRAATASAVNAIRPYAEAQRNTAAAAAGMRIELAALTGTFDKTDAAFYTGAEYVMHFLRTGEGMDEWARKTVAALEVAAKAARKATRYFPGGPESISADDLYKVPEALKPSEGGGAKPSAKGKSPRVKSAKEENAELDALYLELAQNLNSYDAAQNLAAQEARQKEADDEERLRQEGLAAEKEYRDQQVALAKEAADKQLEYTQRVQEDSKSTASNVGSFVGGVSDLVSTLYEQAADNAEEGSVREKKARKTAFAVAKAAAIAQAAINTALAVSQALTMVFPLNYINAAIVGALGAAEVGVIAAKQMPTAHSGGMVATAPDEQPIMALRGEAVLSRQAVQDLGGEQAVSNANRRVGTGDGMVGTFAMVYEHRSYDAFMARDLRRPTGAVRQAIHGTGNAGLIKRSG